ncbi:hypothetical protein M885DRAFT_565085 [Pelagophyceae sp. CCMP2097]|nr:hypothetical protein M885DRAFT_565085 [Pelagophyceae sp. CCMP2097]
MLEGHGAPRFCGITGCCVATKAGAPLPPVVDADDEAKDKDEATAKPRKAATTWWASAMQPGAQQKKPPSNRPAGAPKKYMMWDELAGWGAAADEPSVPRPAPGAAQKGVLPWLVFAFGVGLLTITVCPSMAGSKCPGCAECGSLMCTLCCERNTPGKGKGDPVNPYVRGCASFLKSNVLNHEVAYHQGDRQRQRTVEAGFEQQHAAHRAQLRLLFKNVHFLSKSNMPLLKFWDLCENDRLRGFPTTRLYNNHVMARDILMSLAHVIRELINLAAAKSPALGLMVDESTDVSQTAAIILYLRLQIDGVYRTLMGVLMLLLFCFASDGASVMTGNENGVAVQLRANFNVFMLLVAHRHALASTDAAKDNDVAAFFESSLHSIICYFSKSPKRCKALQAIQKALRLSELRMVRVVATRWLSRAAASRPVYAMIQALVLDFRNDAATGDNLTADALYTLSKSHEFLLSLVLFNTMLEVLAQISTALQKTRVTFSEVDDLVSAAKDFFAKSFDLASFHGGPDYVRFNVARKKEYTKVEKPGSFFDVLGLDAVLVNDDRAAWVLDGASRFAAALVMGLSERFEAASTPWLLLVPQMSDLAEQIQLGNITKDEAYATLLAHDSLADVKVILSIYLILCLSSVPCERGFSTMLIVKTRLRNCLDILTAILGLDLLVKARAIVDVAASKLTLTSHGGQKVAVALRGETEP